jgi:hypothetical protein
MAADLVKVTDYGLGTFKGSPVVLVSMSSRGCYHRTDHGGRINGVTWAEDFARNGLELRPCRICWPSARIDGSPDAEQH